MEAALAQYLRAKGHDVCGSHSSKYKLDAQLFGQIVRKLNSLI
jgi:hypothetical protein